MIISIRDQMMGAEVKALVEKTVMMAKHSYLNVVEEGTKRSNETNCVQNYLAQLREMEKLSTRMQSLQLQRDLGFVCLIEYVWKLSCQPNYLHERTIRVASRSVGLDYVINKSYPTQDSLRTINLNEASQEQGLHYDNDS